MTLMSLMGSSTLQRLSRKFGFVPQAKDLLPSVEECKKARAKLLQSINTHGSGETSFQEFLQWAMV
eukprot:CAMPEP_0172876138 /NCGR_PEP_ID=MMETSP1075-20121228/103474_1 /TAXON_ID=2916 /ORGANISM="Ceratium fusus, Strain PA161109" /LENGTH=65 /DNA_ID=CAMNT_0013727357 /DNA_START=173 /DNA_END=366 /DNA_ORIENTATION=-